MSELFSFGVWVRRRRKALDLTREELAPRVGCSVATIRRIEADERRPSKQLAARLADCLELGPEERAAFLKAARAELAPDQLPAPGQPLHGWVDRSAPHLIRANDRPARPTGTVTFLFTDIETSTRLWEQHPQALRAALARYETLLRQTIVEHGGYVYKLTGDAFQVAFATAHAALAAATAAQRALANENSGPIGPLPVRMALDSGVVEERENDYVGPLLNRLAQLLAAGHGRQILLSAATYELLRTRALPGVTLHALGPHQLKDMLRPEPVYQAVTTDLPADFPPLKSLDRHQTNLPVQLTSLVGREAEVTRVSALLRRADVRLVALTGPGGIGKTRLGLQASANLLDAFADGVYFVDLAPISDPDLVTSTIATTLGLKEVTGQPLFENLKRYLHEKQLLLLLDNFEQVVVAAPAMAELLKAAPALKLLITSRTPLHLSGEHEYVVPPLALPDPQHALAAQQLSQYEAVALFIERALAVKADFQITNHTAPIVAEICHRLDGLPLAIELAAARIKLLSPEALLKRLDHRLPLLTGGPLDLPARQQTLRNTIDWSYNLLDRAEQTLFTRLAVFVGGWSLEAAEAVCNPEGELGVTVLDGLQSLLDKNLLRQAEGPDGAPRFRRLETIREYALERLAASGEAEVLSQQHARYFLKLAEQAEPDLRGPQQAAWLVRLEVEYDNLRAALQWAAQRGDAELVARLAGALWRFWEVRGLWTEGRAWLAEILSDSRAAPLARTGVSAKILHGSAVLAFYQGDHEAAQQLFEQCLALCRELNDRPGIAWTLIYYGWLINDRGDPAAARPLFEESLAICRELGDRQGIGWALGRLGLVHIFLGNHAAARPLLEEGLAMCRAAGDRLGTAWSLQILGVAVSFLDDSSGAMALQRESLAIWRALRDRRNMAYTLMIMGYVTLDQGEYAEAHHLLAEALRLQQEIGDKWGTAFVLWFAAVLSGVRGQAERAVRLESASAALLESIGAALPAPTLTRFIHKLQASRQTLTADQQARAWAEGRAMSLEQTLAYALGEAD